MKPTRLARLGLAAIAFVLALGANAGVANAHEVRPGYLEIEALEDGGHRVLWKVPARGDRKLGMSVQFDPRCTAGEPMAWFAGGAHLERWRIDCEGGLTGTRVAIEGLPLLRTDVVARVERADGTQQTARLTPENPGFEVTATESVWGVIATYFVLGVEHILLGIDHLLFVLALLLLVGDVRRLVATVTAFTVAHSLTLAAAVLGWVHVPPPPVEATIALSIVFVAVEIARGHARGPAAPQDIAWRKPWIVAFAFGLLHGFGFAGALTEVGLPQKAIPAALAFFNVGVEVGQLAFVAVVVGMLAAAARAMGQAGGAFALATRLARPTAYAIGILAAYWLFERTASFLI